jgi:hypothetical protein
VIPSVPEVDPIVWTKNERSFATTSPALVAGTLPLIPSSDRLLLWGRRRCGTSLAPGETEVGSAGEQPTKG